MSTRRSERLRFTSCRDCGERLSKRAYHCPRCGAYRMRWGPPVIALAVLAAIYGAIFLFAT